MWQQGFRYLRPRELAEARAAYLDLRRRGYAVHYYAGGTEILTSWRRGELAVDAVVDLKDIAALRRQSEADGRLLLGAALTLGELADQDAFPLLARVARRIADHTSRAKITLGGNLAGRIPYREAALPFLLGEARALVYGRDDRLWDMPFEAVFQGALRLHEGDILVALAAPPSLLAAPCFAVKHTRLDYVDYPLLTLAAAAVDGQVRLAAAGLFPEPERLAALEPLYQDDAPPSEDRLAERIADLPPFVDDLHGSADYRRFLLTQTLLDLVAALGRGSPCSR